MRCDFENDADIFVGKALVEGTDVGALALVDERDLLADEKLAEFIVRDIDLGLCEDSSIGGLAQELYQEVETNGAVQNARAERMKRVREHRGLSAKLFDIFATSFQKNGIVQILRSKGGSTIGRPADAKFIQEIGRYLHDLRFDQNL